MKTTSNGRRPQILIVEYLSNHYSDLLQILNLSLGDHTKIKILKMKLTLNERQPQNNLSWISQQPLIGSSWNLKLELRGTYQNKRKNLKWRQPPMEDDFTICDLGVLRKKLGEYQRKTRVWLCSAQLVLTFLTRNIWTGLTFNRVFQGGEKLIPPNKIQFNKTQHKYQMFQILSRQGRGQYLFRNL